MPVSAGRKGRDDISIDPWHQNLRLGVAEPTVELQDLDAILGQHTAGIQDPAVFDVLVSEPCQNLPGDLFICFLLDGETDVWEGTDCPHAAGIGPTVSVVHPFVVTSGSERDHGVPVTQVEQ